MISKAEMTTLYEGACAKCRRAPDVSEFKAWLSKLAMFERRDVADALVEWIAQSPFMPTAVQLLPIASKIRNSRLARATEPKLLARWICESCGASRCGFIDSDDRWPRRCKGNPRTPGDGERKRCGATMREVFRAPYSTKEDDQAA